MTAIATSTLVLALLAADPRESASEASPADPFAITPEAPPPSAPARLQDGDFVYVEDERGGWYLQVGGGFVTTEESDGPDEEIDFDEGYAVTVAVGHRFGEGDGNDLAFDLELEGLWTDQDADDDGLLEAVTDVSQLGFFLNGLADLRLGEAFELYGGAGIGLSFLDIGTESDALNDFDEEDGPFLAWQARAGLRWWASETLSWIAGYRFLNVDDAEIDDDAGDADFELETTQHVLELGLRFQL